MWDVVSPSARSKDKKLQTNFETSEVKSACILAKTVNKVAKMESYTDCDVSSVIDRCNDALALLGHAKK